MESEYTIRGIDKIIEKVGRETLARCYEVEQDADFEPLIMQTLREIGVPSGLEVAGYETIDYENPEDQRRLANDYLGSIISKYNLGGKGAIGIPLGFGLLGSKAGDVYFYIDEPVDERIYFGVNKKVLCGHFIFGYMMGKDFYEAHKDEIDKLLEEYSEIWDDQMAFEEYIGNRFDEFKGIRQQDENRNREYTFDWEREQAEREKNRISRAEQIISTLTGGKTIDELTFADLDLIKQRLTDRKEKLRAAFEKRFNVTKIQEEKE